eukprot:3010092-Amphidinium_carterae.1
MRGSGVLNATGHPRIGVFLGQNLTALEVRMSTHAAGLCEQWEPCAYAENASSGKERQNPWNPRIHPYPPQSQ